MSVRPSDLALYHHSTCPFCLRVRAVMGTLGLSIELRNIRENSAYREELIREGGKPQVPCLRIDSGSDRVTWMYESQDIIDYLQTHVAAT